MAIKETVVSQRFAVVPFAAMLLLFVVIAACSSDSDDTGNGGGDTDATEPADGGGDGADGNGDANGDGDANGNGDANGDGDGGSSGSNSATLTVGSESWSFDVTSCTFTNEESRSDQISFRMSGVGETAEGVPIRLQATIQDIRSEGRYEGDGVIHGVEVRDIDDSESQALDWLSSVEIFAELDPVINVDGKNVTAETTFDDLLTVGEFEDVPGALVAVCP